ncbi:gamma-glutamylcyclotransferase [soil metagenome]
MTMNSIRHDTVRAFPCAAPAAPVVTRALLELGGAEALLKKDAPCAKLLTDAERAASLEAILRVRPAGELWIFAYGSLIWNPALKSAERRTARVNGWRRSFCLSMTAGRGTPNAPGLVLGLDQGGSCLGATCRIAEEDLATELPILWRREMMLGGYIPRWVELIDDDGVVFGNAIAFTIDTQSQHYAGSLPLQVVVNRLATAAGGWGSSADYLFQTRDGLRARGIPDPDLERLAALVEAAQLGLDLPRVA